MQLDKLCINTKKRSPWEAIDLGCKLAINWFKPLFLLYAIPFYITASIVSILCYWLIPEYFWVSFIGMWFLKPIFDRAPLYFASRALFSEYLSVKTVLSNLVKINRFDAIKWITWRRLSPTRCFDLPITVLEGLTGSDRSKRLSIMHVRGSGEAIMLSLICFLSEILLAGGLDALISLLLPESLYDKYSILTSDIAGGHFNFFILSYFFLAPLVSPFFVCSGFMIYINRRVQLEAWDIDIQFQKMAKKDKYRSTGNLSLTLASLLLGCALFSSSTPTLAEPDSFDIHLSVEEFSEIELEDEVVVEDLSSKRQIYQQAIIEIYESPDFRQTKEVTKWRWKQSSQNSDSWSDGLLQKIRDFFQKLFESSPKVDIGEAPDLNIIAVLVKYLLIGALITAVVYLLNRYKENFAFLTRHIQWKRKFRAQQPKPEILFGLDVTKENLPEDIPQEVLALYDQNKPRQAVSLLYRACLTKLMHQKGFHFYESQTEGECLQTVTRSGNQKESDYLKKITQLWQSVAYGHTLPNRSPIEELCLSWQGVFPNEN